VIAELEQRSVVIGPQQVIGLCPAAAANESAVGRLLEGRLAAAAARRGAELCAAKGDDEHLRLAARLEQVAGQLAGSGIEQEELLAAAERAVALIGVLVAAGVLDHELQSMLDIAARGLRAALLPTTLSQRAARVTALDRTLEAKD
jgi:hypothetical protein